MLMFFKLDKRIPYGKRRRFNNLSELLFHLSTIFNVSMYDFSIHLDSCNNLFPKLSDYCYHIRLDNFVIGSFRFFI